MQFTVLIEFLVPGLATTLLVLLLFSDGAVPQMPQGLPAGETASALLLLAVSYPVGILTNFPIFHFVQRRIVSVRARRRIVEKYELIGADLVTLVNTQCGVTLSKPLPRDREGLATVFSFMRSFVFSKNVERLNANHLYHEGIQRFARGMLLPLLLACVVVCIYRTPQWPLLILLCALLSASSWTLLLHSVRTEDEQIARFFVILTSTPQSTPAHCHYPHQQSPS